MKDITTINKLLITLNIFLIFSCSDLIAEKLIYGCTDVLACNYNLNSNTDDNSCYYSEEYYNCEGICLSDEDNDAVCDPIDPCIGTYDDNGYYCEDLHVLQDFINENPSLNSSDIFDIIFESWFNDEGRLRYLSLSNLSLISVPESIGVLDDLEQLFLTDNNLTSIPESICDIPSSCEIFVQGNNLCLENGTGQPLYDFDCIDQFNPQYCDE